MDIKIIEDLSEINFISKQFQKKELFKYKNISYDLIFRATRDGCSPAKLHEKVDRMYNTVVIIKANKGLEF